MVSPFPVALSHLSCTPPYVLSSMFYSRYRVKPAPVTSNFLVLVSCLWFAPSQGYLGDIFLPVPFANTTPCTTSCCTCCGIYISPTATFFLFFVHPPSVGSSRNSPPPLSHCFVSILPLWLFFTCVPFLVTVSTIRNPLCIILSPSQHQSLCYIIQKRRFPPSWFWLVLALVCWSVL